MPPKATRINRGNNPVKVQVAIFLMIWYRFINGNYRSCRAGGTSGFRWQQWGTASAASAAGTAIAHSAGITQVSARLEEAQDRRLEPVTVAVKRARVALLPD